MKSKSKHRRALIPPFSPSQCQRNRCQDINFHDVRNWGGGVEGKSSVVVDYSCLCVCFCLIFTASPRYHVRLPERLFLLLFTPANSRWHCASKTRKRNVTGQIWRLQNVEEACRLYVMMEAFFFPFSVTSVSLWLCVLLGGASHLWSHHDTCLKSSNQPAQYWRPDRSDSCVVTRCYGSLCAFLCVLCDKSWHSCASGFLPRPAGILIRSLDLPPPASLRPGPSVISNSACHPVPESSVKTTCLLVTINSNCFWSQGLCLHIKFSTVHYSTICISYLFIAVYYDVSANIWLVM